jgi:hypothetical protein
MSSPEPAAAKVARNVKPAGSAAKLRATAKPQKAGSGVTVLRRAKAHAGAAKNAPQKREPSQRASKAAALAKELEQGLAEGRLDMLPPQALQALMAALCKTYAANIEAGHAFPLLGNRSAVTSTDVMVACAALLKSADLQVFELGMWQSWTGR